MFLPVRGPPPRGWAEEPGEGERVSVGPASVGPGVPLCRPRAQHEARGPQRGSDSQGQWGRRGLAVDREGRRGTAWDNEGLCGIAKYRVGQ